MFFFFLSKRYKKGLNTFFHLLTLLLLSALLISYPSFIFSAAKKGLDTWWQFVLPGLFPFFILVELLAQFGVIDFL
ncbi:MAG: hypothetical protein WDA53_09130, partial [Bacillota bacterium]